MLMPSRPVDRIAPPLAFALLVSIVVVALPAWVAGQTVDEPARQVTLFGVLASPHDRGIDPKLAKIEPQLRKLFPGHGFRLLDVQSKRLTAGQTMAGDLEGGYTARTTLLQPADTNGKVQLRCSLLLNRTVELETVVATPPNQLFFCDKKLNGGSRLLIAVGAR